jgi:hypothetical protein
VLWPCVHCECCDHACTPPLRRLVVVHCECCGHACTPPLRRLVVFTSIAMSSLQPASPFDSTQGKRSLSAKPFCILLWLLTLAVVDMLSHANTHMCGLRLMPSCPPPSPPPPHTHTPHPQAPLVPCCAALCRSHTGGRCHILSGTWTTSEKGR